MTTLTTVQLEALRVARAHRGEPDPEEVASLRRGLAEAKLSAYIAKVIASAPPLTPAQRDRLVALLAGAA